MKISYIIWQFKMGGSGKKNSKTGRVAIQDGTFFRPKKRGSKLQMAKNYKFCLKSEKEKGGGVLTFLQTRHWKIPVDIFVCLLFLFHLTTTDDSYC